MKEKNYFKRRSLLLPTMLLFLADSSLCASLSQLNRYQLADVVKTSNPAGASPTQDNHEFVDMT